MRLAQALRHFYRLSQVTMDRLMRAEGASWTRTRLLAFIAQEAGTRSVDIAEAFGYAPRTVTEALDALERAGLVSRTPSLEDRRSKIIGITEAGRRALDASEAVGRRFADTIFTRLSGDEQETLAQLMGRLNERMEEYVASGEMPAPVNAG